MRYTRMTTLPFPIKTCWLACLLLWVGVVTHGQEITYQVEHFTTEQGMTDHRPRALLFHSNGFIYVGTVAGMCRFDGYEFHPIALPNLGGQDLSTGFVYRLSELSDGRIAVFVAPENTELQMVIHDPETGASVYDRRLGFDRYTWPESVVVQGEEIDLLNHPNRLTVDSLTDSYGNRFVFEGISSSGEEGGTAKVIFANGDELDLSETILSTGSYVSVFSQDIGKLLYVLTNNNGILKISIFPPDFERLLSSEVEGWQYKMQCRVVSEHRNRLYVGALNQGLLESVNGSAFRELTFKMASGDNFALKQEIRGISPINDSLLLAATLSRGAAVINIERRTAALVPGSSGMIIMHALELPGNEVLLPAIPGKGKGASLMIFDKTTQRAEFHSLDSLGWERKHIESVGAFDPDGFVWLGTTTGLIKFSWPDLRATEVYLAKSDNYVPPDQSLLVHRVLSSSHIIALRKSGSKLWIGTLHAGAHILDTESGEIVNLDRESGLTSDAVCAFLPDETGMWIATYNGLSHMDSSTQTMSHFSMQNGLSHNEFNRWSGYISPDGKYYLGTMNGVTAFYPDQVLKKSRATTVLLSEAGYYDGGGKNLIVQNSDFGASPTFTLPATNRSFYAKVALSNFQQNTLNNYSYRLESTSGEMKVDDTWRNNGNDREIRFEYLPAGSYVLQVRGISAGGVAASEDLIIQLEVQEFIYKQTWFIVLCFLVALGIMWLFYRYRIQQAIRIERLRTRLSSDLHDDVGGLLSGVALQMEVLEHSVPEKNKALVQRVARSSRKAMEQMRDVVWAIDARQQSLQDLRERMLEFCEEVLSPAELGYRIEMGNVQPELNLSTELRHNLLRIFKEFANNTVKHADAQMVVAKFNKDGKKLIMEIADDGKGADVEKLSGTGQGLRNMKMRAERINGSLGFFNNNGFGVRVSVPMA